MGPHGGCLARGLVCDALQHYCPGGWGALLVCSRRSRQVRRAGPVTVPALFCQPLVSSSVGVAGCPFWVCLGLACSYANPGGPCVPRARSGSPSSLCRLPVAWLCPRPPAAPLPPPPPSLRAHPARFLAGRRLGSSRSSVPLRVSRSVPLLCLPSVAGGVGPVPVFSCLSSGCLPAGGWVRAAGDFRGAGRGGGGGGLALVVGWPVPACGRGGRYSLAAVWRLGRLGGGVGSRGWGASGMPLCSAPRRTA